MSSSVDDESSYDSVADERIGGIYSYEQEEQNETEAQIVIPPPEALQERAPGDAPRRKRETGLPTTLRQIFPPFFFPVPDAHAHLDHHLNRRRTWGSSAYLYAQRQIIESVLPATLFRVVVAVFHLSRDNSRYTSSDHRTTSDSSGNPIASVPMKEVISYLQFLARECHVRIPENQNDESLWQYYFPALVEASKESISGKHLVRSMEDAVDPLALELDLAACRSVSLREWKAFFGIPVPSPIDLTDISPDTVQLMEWWKSLERILEDACVDISDQQSLHGFLDVYCNAVDDAVLKYTCRGMTSKLGCIEKRKCGMLLDNLGHHPSSKEAHFSFTTRRLVACDLLRVFGNMRLSAGFFPSMSNEVAESNGCEEAHVRRVHEAENESDTSTSLGRRKYCQHAPLSLGETSMPNHSLGHREAADADLFSSDDKDDSDDSLVRTPRIYRRIKRGITTSNDLSSVQKRVRCEHENSSNYCEVSRAMQVARETYRTHSDQDEDSVNDDDNDSI